MGVTVTNNIAATYVPIQNQTLSTSSTAITFYSIPSTYTDLVLICSINNSSSTNSKVRVGNNSLDVGTNYSATQIYASGSGSAGSLRIGTVDYALGGVDGGYATMVLNFMNYSNSTTLKSWLSRGSSPSSYISSEVNVWRVSSLPINIIQIFPDSGSFPVGSTFTLYGIKAA